MLDNFGLRTESLMSIDEMETTVAMASVEAENCDSSKQVHEDEEEDTKYETGQCGIPSHLWFATDDVSGTPMDPRLPTTARKEQMRYFKEMGIYVKVSKQECWAQTGTGPIAMP